MTMMRFVLLSLAVLKIANAGEFPAVPQCDGPPIPYFELDDSPAPTSRPVMDPVSPPSRSPLPPPEILEDPIPDPTPGPTHAPTPGPTHAPTPGPTHAPTPGPTHAPTPGPTHAPTPGPTHAPTPGPTHAPTLPQCDISQYEGECNGNVNDLEAKCGYQYEGMTGVTQTCGANGVCFCDGEACGCKEPVTCPDFDLNFADAVPGEYVRDQWAESHGVMISAKKASGCGTAYNKGYTPYGAPRVFDTANPGTDNNNGDPDLGAPNNQCSPAGPGHGPGGVPSASHPNCSPQGKSLIIQEMRKEFPDDVGCGGEIIFDFYHEPAFIGDVGLLDVDGDESVEILLIRANGLPDVFIDTVFGFGDNCFVNKPVNVDNVVQLKLIFSGSGTISYIKHRICPPAGEAINFPPFPEAPAPDCGAQYFQKQCSGDSFCQDFYDDDTAKCTGNVCYTAGGDVSGCSIGDGTFDPFPAYPACSDYTASGSGKCGQAGCKWQNNQCNDA